MLFVGIPPMSQINTDEENAICELIPNCGRAKLLLSRSVHNRLGGSLARLCLNNLSLARLFGQPSFLPNKSD
jgi:hypothetical protein